MKPGIPKYGLYLLIKQDLQTRLILQTVDRVIEIIDLFIIDIIDNR